MDAKEQFQKIEDLRDQKHKLEDAVNAAEKQYREELAGRKALDKENYLNMHKLRNQLAEVRNELHSLI